MAQAVEKVYNRSVAGSWSFRPKAEIRRFFDGFDLVEPGLVAGWDWRPDDPLADHGRVWGLLGGVGRKP
jgi:hypothetical protein